MTSSVQETVFAMSAALRAAFHAAPKRRRRGAPACLILGVVAVLAATEAHAIVGGVEVAGDDPGGRAAVIVETTDGSCTGLVLGDDLVITNAHCLIRRDFTAPLAPNDVTITYGLSLKHPDAARRSVAALTIHENFLQQVARNLSATGPVALADRLVHHEDIAVIRIEGKHPSGALGAELPAIDNDYVVCCVPQARSWPLVWMDVYGFGAAPIGEALHKLRMSAVAPDMVWRGVEPKGDYRPRQFVTERVPPSADGPRGICHGDSGGPAFVVAKTRTRQIPNEPIRLQRGHPLALGLVSWAPESERSPAGCSESSVLIRLDYYRDWILARGRALQ
jgi:hypothetical protein